MHLQGTRRIPGRKVRRATAEASAVVRPAQQIRYDIRHRIPEASFLDRSAGLLRLQAYEDPARWRADARENVRQWSSGCGLQEHFLTSIVNIIRDSAMAPRCGNFACLSALIITAGCFRR